MSEHHPGIVFLAAGLGGQWVRWYSPCVPKDWRALTCRANVGFHGFVKENTSTPSFTHPSWRSANIQIISDSDPCLASKYNSISDALVTSRGGGTPCHGHWLSNAMTRKTTPRTSRWTNSTRRWGPTTSRGKRSICHLSPGLSPLVTTRHHLCLRLWRRICERWDPSLRFFTGLGMWIDLAGEIPFTSLYFH